MVVLQSMKKASQSHCFNLVYFLSVFRYILESASFVLFFKFVELPNFDVASDAFSTFKVRTELSLILIPFTNDCKVLHGTSSYFPIGMLLQDLLTKHVNVVSEFLTAHYDEVCFMLDIFI